MVSRSTIAEAGYAPGAPLVVGVSPGGVLAQGGFDEETLTYAASLAKQITGACAALLARRGALDPDAPIGEWLDDLPHWRAHVRVRHLLHHTAGVPDVWPQMQRRGESAWTSAGVLAALRDVPRLEAEPGSTYAYSSAGYICLAGVVERVAGTPFCEFAATNIFEPLRLERTRFWTGPAAAPPGAAFVPNGPPALSAGDGGLWTTVSDLLRWNQAVLDDALGVTAIMHTPGSLDDGTPLDYAWGVRVFEARGQIVHSHGGDYGGATAKLVRLPERSTSFAALAADGSVARMAALGALLQTELIER